LPDDDDHIPPPGDTARSLIRRADRATLATRMRDTDGEPYASLVLTAAAHDGSPVLLISGLAEHTKNIAADPRVSLLFDGTAGYDDPLTGPRVSVQGRAIATDSETLRDRFLARHPAAAMYAGFGDFAFYAIETERAHLVAGFGRIDWITADDLLFDSDPAAGLAAREPDIVEHMNTDHADAIALYARVLLGCAGDDWRMTGIDPEGIDMACKENSARLTFDGPVLNADDARLALATLAKRARQSAT
jgi:heme iron utilization protein